MAKKTPGLAYLSKMYDALKAKVDGFISREEFNQLAQQARSHAGGKAKAEKMKADTAALVAFERSFQEDGPHHGLMVCFYLSEGTAAQLAIPDGEAVADLHVTLCFLGDASQYSELALAEIIIAARDQSRWQAALNGKVSGSGRFIGDDVDVYYASVDVPGLNEFRTDLARRLAAAGTPVQTEHGFDPHITLAYLDPSDPTPDYDLSDISLRFDMLTVKFGDRRVDIPMSPMGCYSEVAVLCADGKEMKLFVEQDFAEPPEWFNYLPKPGKYTSPRYGEIVITRERNQNFVDNFKDAVYQEKLPIDAEHETALSGACAWIVDMRVNDDGSVDAKPEWTDRGTALIENDRFKYFSPSWFESWTDPATEKSYNDVAIGGALTTRPFFKQNALRPLVANEQGLAVLENDLPQNFKTGDVVNLVFTALTPATEEQPEGANEMTTAATTPTTQQFSELTTRVEAAERKATEMETKAEEHRQAAEKAQTDLKMANETITKLSTDVGDLQKERRISRFTEKAKGFVGDRAKHVQMMEFISEHSEKGEESDEFKAYCESQEAAAKQFTESGLVKEFGRDTNASSDNAVDEVQTKARAMCEKDAKLNMNDAIQQVLANDSKLYQRYTTETAVRV